MIARILLCLSLLVASTAQAQTPPPELVDDLFAAARFDENLINLRNAAMADWRAAGETAVSAENDPGWEQAMLDGNDPNQIAADFRRGFLSVPFSQADMQIAIAELGTPFGQRLTDIGVNIADLLAQAEGLAGAFAAAELTNGRRVVAADRVLALRGSVETQIAFQLASEEAFFLGLRGQDIDAAGLDDDVGTALDAHLAEWETYLEEILPEITLNYRQTFFLVTEGFTPEEVDAWVTRAEQPWAQSFEAAFQAGYVEAYRHSMYRQGQALAAFGDAQ